jgi:hypothetical protein
MQVLKERKENSEVMCVFLISFLGEAAASTAIFAKKKRTPFAPPISFDKCEGVSSTFL